LHEGVPTLCGCPSLQARIQNIENNPMQSREGFEFAALFAAARPDTKCPAEYIPDVEQRLS
jgi:hypothetical protein